MLGIRSTMVIATVVALAWGCGSEGGNGRGDDAAGGSGGEVTGGRGGEGGSNGDSVHMMKIAPDTLTLFAGETRQFQATALDEHDEPLDDIQMNWVSEDETVATVDPNGLLTALLPGSVSITVSAEGKSATAQVTVEPSPVASVKVTPTTAIIDEQKTTQLEATLYDEGGNELSGFTVTWTSENPAIATVDAAGLVKGRLPGSTTITASAGEKTATVALTVTEAVIASITIEPSTEIALEVGESIQLTAVPRDADGNALAGRAATWSSSDPSIVVDAAGMVGAAAKWAWGSGQVEAEIEGRTALASIRIQLHFVELSSGAGHGCALTASGKAWCWGSGGDGRLGNGSTESSSIPIPVDTEIAFHTISSGSTHTCGIDLGGKAWCWGSARFGALGTDSTPESTLLPLAVAGDHEFRSISAGASSTCAIDTEGKGWCWGRIAESTNSPVSLDEEYESLQIGVTSVSGVLPACGETAAGERLCWGLNNYGQLLPSGGSPIDTPTPPMAGKFLSLALGQSHSCGVLNITPADRRTHCWGAGASGELGDDSFPERDGSFQVDVPALASVTAGSAFSCGLTQAAGVAWCWGSNVLGQLGRGSPVGTDAKSAVPAPVSGDHRFVSLSAGRSFVCGITDDGTYCWGNHGGGALGNGSTISNSNVPVLVTGTKL